MTGAGALRLPVAVRTDVRPFIVVSGACVVAGGLVAAVTGPLGLEVGSWTAAFLVLVGGVAQVALGVGQAWLGRPGPRLRQWELVAWNASVIVTIVGTVGSLPVLTSAAGALLVGALGLFLVGTGSNADEMRGWRIAYRSLVTFVLLSVPVGLALAWIRHG